MKSKLAIAYQIEDGLRSQGAELTKEDVGCPIGKLSEGMGFVLKIDIGKRVWVKEYGTVMENAEQRDERKKNEKL